MLKSIVGVFALVLALGTLGCQSTGMGSAAPDHGPEKGMVSASPKGAVVYLSGHNGTVQILTPSGAAACDVCKSDAALYFSTGKMSEKCTVCGAMHYGVMRGK